MATLYLLLSIGALTTLFPFATMLTTGFKGATDQNDNRLIPAFWTDESELATKFRDAKYAGDARLLASYKMGAAADPATVAKYQKFLETLPLDQWTAGFTTASNNVTGRLQDRWIEWVKRKYPYLELANHAYLEINGSYQMIRTPSEQLDQKNWSPNITPKWTDWLEFKAKLPAEFRIPITARHLFQEFLRTKCEGQLDRLEPALRGKAKQFEDVALQEDHPLYREFVDARLPAAFLPTSTIEAQWRKLSDKELPILSEEISTCHTQAATLRQEFSSQNYRFVIGYMMVNGQAFQNTAIFCILAIAVQLTVNPLAAYALSRFPIKATGRILLFLLATMAFPAEVTMIPGFLLLKNLGLLNTFAALVLPGAASGYMIFLLKGFFDSLPQEIFESGQIDGAPEWMMMLKLAFPLSRPVLGYLALLAFMGAYSAFIFAFLVAQDRKMWTLMVFVYQLQQMAPKAVMMAATTLAALPTLIVFLLAQRVILKGIVLPGER